mgnify:CR=1 FL=1
MCISRIALYRYRLPLTAPIHLGPQTITHRTGALVRVDGVRDGMSGTGWGDAAPLPGFSDHSLADALDELTTWASAAVGRSLGRASLVDLDADHAMRCGTTRFAAESACLSAFSSTASVALPVLLREAPRPTVSLNALLDADAPDRLHEAALQIREANYRAVKVKVGRTSVDDDVERVRAVVEALGDAVALRLDANRAWTFDDATRFVRQIPTNTLAYLEEPLADPTSLAAWHAASGCPVALDETAREMDADTIFDTFPFARAVVLKPALIGVRATQRWAALAAAHDAEVVVSSAYESGVGLRMLVALASTLGSRDVPAGLDTYRRLRRDVLSDPLPIRGSQVDVSSLFRTSPSVRDGMLEPIATVSAH